MLAEVIFQYLKYVYILSLFEKYANIGWAEGRTWVWGNHFVG